MTDERKAALEAYLRYLGDGLGLKDWGFEVSDKPPRGEFAKAEGASHVRWQSPLSTVWFPGRVLDDPVRLRQTAIHEVLHPHMEIPWATVHESCKRHLPKSEWQTFEAAYRRHVELGIDRLANALAPLFDLPVIPPDVD
jgi:hypothetical protein